MAFLAAAYLGILVGCDQGEHSKHSENQKLVDEGLEALKYYDYNLAGNKLSKVQPNLDKGSDSWDRITFAAAIAAWHSSPPSAHNIELASSFFQQVIDHASDAQIIALAKISLGRIYEVSDYRTDEVDLPKAQSLYREVLSSESSNDLVSEATLRLAQTYVQTLTQEGLTRAISILGNHLESYPNSNWRSVVAQYLGDIYYERLNDPKNALNYYQIALEEGFANKTKEHIYIWRMAEFAKRSDQALLSTVYSTKLVEEYPRSQYGWFALNNIRRYNEANPDDSVPLPEMRNAFLEGVGQ
ncbi:hypothetical protein GCM10007047_19150 [Cerasicoccus arenae]|uniref:Outer membrane lipoprotein BamD-like domain-containing protein n=1 Tax=Cerasicoccus arenae TaxID=424488 RepID=A0A8J3DHZ3_9BACT|nr:hypothetical protein GCM10007047_19150 [Cerasicoccus arenae]